MASTTQVRFLVSDFLVSAALQSSVWSPMSDPRPLHLFSSLGASLQFEVAPTIYSAVCERAARTDAFPLTGAQSSS